jgi:predicted RNase H-like HicB family nuclease/predicted RNA binding protein YcfA (HicA-like mRNA interferase family)
MRYVCFKEYVREILKAAEFKRDTELDCVVAVAPALKGCMTQGDNFEESRDNLMDAIELWMTVALKDGEEAPIIDNTRLATSVEQIEKIIPIENAVHAGNTSCPRNLLVKKLRVLGFEGPFVGGKHSFMRRGRDKQIIPNPQGKEISSELIIEILKHGSISTEEWLKAARKF